MIVTTMNRTLLCGLCVIALGESALRIMPPGAHLFHMFKTPGEVRHVIEDVWTSS